VFGPQAIADPVEREAMWKAYEIDMAGEAEAVRAECVRVVPTPQYVRGWLAALAWRAERPSPVPAAVATPSREQEARQSGASTEEGMRDDA
jgi:hypothetical protein